MSDKINCNTGYCLYKKQNIVASRYNEACSCFDCPRPTCDATCSMNQMAKIGGMERFSMCDACMGKTR